MTMTNLQISAVANPAWGKTNMLHKFAAKEMKPRGVDLTRLLERVVKLGGGESPNPEGINNKTYPFQDQAFPRRMFIYLRERSRVFLPP